MNWKLIANLAVLVLVLMTTALAFAALSAVVMFTLMQFVGMLASHPFDSGAVAAFTLIIGFFGGIGGVGVGFEVAGDMMPYKGKKRDF